MEKEFKDLEELRIEEDGRIRDLEGKTVKAQPIGESWIITIQGEGSNETVDIDFFKRKANEHYQPPCLANAYVLGSGTHFVGHEISVRPIQTYRKIE
jgi:hypothetical protein